MTFLSPGLLSVLLVVPLLVLGYYLMQRRRKKYALRYASLSLVKEAVGRGPGFRRHIPAIIFLAGLTALLVGVARPAATVMLPSQQGTVILTLDVSGSMRADDLKPSRLEAAKAAARTFVEKQPANVRVGLVTFSDNPAIVQAPTTDREALIGAIGRLSPQRGTAIGRGILSSLDAIFEEPGKPAPITSDALLPQPSAKPIPAPAPAPRRGYAPAVIVLLSDGQSNVGPPPLDVVKEASDRGVRVFTVGVGQPGGTILKVDGRSMRVLLDEDTLQRIAQRTDGEYYRATGETDLRRIYDSLSTQLVFETKETELTAFFAGGALVVLIAAGILSMLWFSRLL